MTKFHVNVLTWAPKVYNKK